MRLEDLRAMNIPDLAPIEVEFRDNLMEKDCRLVGYFRDIFDKPSSEKGYVEELRYHSVLIGRSPPYGSIPIEDIHSVTILVPKE